MTPDQIISIAELSGWFVGGLIGVWLLKKIVGGVLAKTSLGGPSDSIRAFTVTYIVSFGVILLAVFGNRSEYEDPAEHLRITYAIVTAFLVYLAVDLFRRSRRKVDEAESE